MTTCLYIHRWPSFNSRFYSKIRIEAVDNKITHGIDCSKFIVTPIEGQNIYINFNIKVGSNKRTVWSMLYMTWHFGILSYCRRFPLANRRTSRTLMTSPHCTSRFRRRLTHLSRQHTSWTSKSALVIRIHLFDGCLYTANMWSPLKYYQLNVNVKIMTFYWPSIRDVLRRKTKVETCL